MDAPTVETSQRPTSPQPADPVVSGTAVTAVGAFAAGHSEHASIHVAADAETGKLRLRAPRDRALRHGVTVPARNPLRIRPPAPTSASSADTASARLPSPRSSKDPQE